MKIYAMEKGFLERLLSDRAEIMEVARSLKTADEMRAARSQVMESLSAINVTPKNDEQLRQSYSVKDGIARIPIVGELTQQAETDVCGGYTVGALTEYGFIIAATQAADSDDEVESIQYFVDSPGGYVDGVAEAVDAIRAAEKPTSAIVGSMAASAAYWLASQTDKITARSIGSRIGSIGVAVEAYDDTEMLEEMGIKRRIFTSTEAPDKRLDLAIEDDQNKLVSTLDDLHAIFSRSVAEGRGTDIETVNKKYGRGGVLLSEQALSVGMIDEIKKVPSRREETISDVVGNQTAATAEEIKEEVKMDNLEELRKEAPGLYAEAVEVGVNQERERQRALDEQLEVDPKNPKLAEVISKAKAEGKNVEQINTRIMVAIRDNGLDGENAPGVKTTEGSGGLTDEDYEAAEAAGMTVDEYKEAINYLEKEVV